jgi:hypothetical protein
MSSVCRVGRVAVAFTLLALVAPACRDVRRPAASAAAEDFHRSDPRIIGTTGHPQLLEFFGPT